MWFFTVFSTMPEPLGDLPVGHPLADELDDAQLAGRQVLRRVVVPGLVPGDRPLVEQGPPGRDGADHLGDLRTAHGLQQVRGCPLVERGRQRVVVVERRQDDRPRLGQPLAQRAQELDPGAVRQLQVHEHDLRPHQVGAPHPVRHRAGLRDDGHALGPVHDLRDAATDHLVVVDDHHGDGTCRRRWVRPRWHRSDGDHDPAAHDDVRRPDAARRRAGGALRRARAGARRRPRRRGARALGQRPGAGGRRRPPPHRPALGADARGGSGRGARGGVRRRRRPHLRTRAARRAGRGAHPRAGAGRGPAAAGPRPRAGGAPVGRRARRHAGRRGPATRSGRSTARTC